MKPKVSVIVPTFNRPDLLEKCLKSIKDSCYENYELIAIDDGSTDPANLKIIQKYSDKPHSLPTQSGTLIRS